MAMLPRRPPPAGAGGEPAAPGAPASGPAGAPAGGGGGGGAGRAAAGGGGARRVHVGDDAYGSGPAAEAPARGAVLAEVDERVPPAQHDERAIERHVVPPDHEADGGPRHDVRAD